MIIQGSNNPLVIRFDADVSGCAKLVVSLWGQPGTPLKTWTMDDMTVEGDTVYCQITEEETAGISAARVTLEAKGLDENGSTLFWAAADVDITKRRDRVIQLTGA